MWVGTGSSATSSYVGLRFAGVTIPRNATITSARLEVNAASTAWITLGFEFGIEAAASSAPVLRGQPALGSAPCSRRGWLHSSNQQWTANSWIVLDDLSTILQALVEPGRLESRQCARTDPARHGRCLVAQADQVVRDRPRPWRRGWS